MAKRWLVAPIGAVKLQHPLDQVNARNLGLEAQWNGKPG